MKAPLRRARVLAAVLVALAAGPALVGCGPVPERPQAAGAAAAPAADGSVRLFQDAAIFGEIQARLASPGPRLWVEMYEFGREDLAAALAAARSAGADVRVLTDPSVAQSVRLAGRLRAAGVPVRFYPLDDRVHQIDHVKLLLTSQVGLVGGMNWGASSHLNHDYALESEASRLLGRLAAIFEQDWSLAGGAPAPLAPVVEAAAQTAPGQEIRDLLGRDLAGARTRILAEVFDLTDVEVVSGLAAAARRGVSVRVLLDPNQAVNQRAFGLLRSAGVPVRWYPVLPPAKLHAKTGLFDGRLVVGSANWSQSGLSSNHELDLETTDPSAVGAYEQRFETDWARSR